MLKKNNKKLKKLLFNLISLKTYTKNPEAVSFLKKALKENGWKNIKEFKGNVWGEIGSGKTKIIYDAHYDTIRAIPHRWEHHPFKPVIKNGFIYGRGSVDDKGILASMIYSGNFIKGENCKIYMLASANEESDEGFGLRMFFKKEKIKPDYALIGEPSNLNFVSGQRGRIEVILESAGIPAHASNPQKGKNPIYEILKSIEKIKNIKFKKVSPFPPSSIEPTVIKTVGDGVNAIPEKCVAVFDMRINHVEDIHLIKNLIEKNVPRGIKIKFRKYEPAWMLSKNDIFYNIGVNAYKKAFGKYPRPYYWRFCTNGSEYAKNNIRVAGFGPGDPDMAHRINERIKFEDMLKAVSFYAALPQFIK